MTARRPWYHDRKSRQQRGYGAAWEKLRKLILQRDAYLCQPCREAGKLTPAKSVDHIVPKAKGGTDDPGNLRAICHDCHDAKTRRDLGQRPRVRIAADGWPEP